MRSTLIVVSLVGLTALAYRGVLYAGFVYEDRHWLADLTGSLQPTANLARWSLQANTAVGGSSPVGFHLVNLLVHLVNGLLVGLLIWNVTQRETVAWMAMAIFLWHPIQVEAVAYVSGRPDLLSTMAVLTVMLLMLVSMREYAISFRIVALLAAGLVAWIAIATRVTTIALVPLVALLAWQIHRWSWGLGVAVGVSTLGVVVVWCRPWYEALAHVSPWTMISYAATQSVAWWNLVSLVVLPIGLSVDHDYAVVGPVVRGMALLSLLAVLGAALCKRRLIAFGVVWAIVAVLPRFAAVGIYRPHLPEVLNEHQWYLAMVGVSVASGVGLTDWMEGEHGISKNAVQGAGLP